MTINQLINYPIPELPVKQNNFEQQPQINERHRDYQQFVIPQFDQGQINSQTPVHKSSFQRHQELAIKKPPIANNNNRTTNLTTTAQNSSDLRIRSTPRAQERLELSRQNSQKSLKIAQIEEEKSNQLSSGDLRTDSDIDLTQSGQIEQMKVAVEEEEKVPAASEQVKKEILNYRNSDTVFVSCQFPQFSPKNLTNFQPSAIIQEDQIFQRKSDRASLFQNRTQNISKQLKKAKTLKFSNKQPSSGETPQQSSPKFQDGSHLSMFSQNVLMGSNQEQKRPFQGSIVFNQLIPNKQMHTPRTSTGIVSILETPLYRVKQTKNAENIQSNEGEIEQQYSMGAKQNSSEKLTNNLPVSNMGSIQSKNSKNSYNSFQSKNAANNHKKVLIPSKIQFQNDNSSFTSSNTTNRENFEIQISNIEQKTLRQEKVELDELEIKHSQIIKKQRTKIEKEQENTGFLFAQCDVRGINAINSYQNSSRQGDKVSQAEMTRTFQTFGGEQEEYDESPSHKQFQGCSSSQLRESQSSLHQLQAERNVQSTTFYSNDKNLASSILNRINELEKEEKAEGKNCGIVVYNPDEQYLLSLLKFEDEAQQKDFKDPIQEVDFLNLHQNEINQPEQDSIFVDFNPIIEINNIHLQELKQLVNKSNLDSKKHRKLEQGKSFTIENIIFEEPRTFNLLKYDQIEFDDVRTFDQFSLIKQKRQKKEKMMNKTLQSSDESMHSSNFQEMQDLMNNTQNNEDDEIDETQSDLGLMLSDEAYEDFQPDFILSNRGNSIEHQEQCSIDLISLDGEENLNLDYFIITPEKLIELESILKKNVDFMPSNRYRQQLQKRIMENISSKIIKKMKTISKNWDIYYVNDDLINYLCKKRTHFVQLKNYIEDSQQLSNSAYGDILLRQNLFSQLIIKAKLRSPNTKDNHMQHGIKTHLKQALKKSFEQINVVSYTEEVTKLLNKYSIQKQTVLKIKDIALSIITKPEVNLFKKQEIYELTVPEYENCQKFKNVFKESPFKYSRLFMQQESSGIHYIVDLQPLRIDKQFYELLFNTKLNRFLQYSKKVKQKVRTSKGKIAKYDIGELNRVLIHGQTYLENKIYSNITYSELYGGIKAVSKLIFQYEYDLIKYRVRDQYKQSLIDAYKKILMISAKSIKDDKILQNLNKGPIISFRQKSVNELKNTFINDKQIQSLSEKFHLQLTKAKINQPQKKKMVISTNTLEISYFLVDDIKKFNLTLAFGYQESIIEGNLLNQYDAELVEAQKGKDGTFDAFKHKIKTSQFKKQQEKQSNILSSGSQNQTITKKIKINQKIESANNEKQVSFQLNTEGQFDIQNISPIKSEDKDVLNQDLSFQQCKISNLDLLQISEKNDDKSSSSIQSVSETFKQSLEIQKNNDLQTPTFSPSKQARRNSFLMKKSASLYFPNKTQSNNLINGDLSLLKQDNKIDRIKSTAIRQEKLTQSKAIIKLRKEILFDVISIKSNDYQNSSVSSDSSIDYLSFLQNLNHELELDQKHQENFQNRQQLEVLDPDEENFSNLASRAKKQLRVRTSSSISFEDKEIFSPIVIREPQKAKYIEQLIVQHIVDNQELPNVDKSINKKPYSFQLRSRFKETSLIDKFSCLSDHSFDSNTKKAEVIITEDIDETDYYSSISKSFLGSQSILNLHSMSKRSIDMKQKLKNKMNYLNSNLQSVMKQKKVRLLTNLEEEKRQQQVFQDEYLELISKIKGVDQHCSDSTNDANTSNQKFRMIGKNLICRKRKLRSVGIFQDIAKQKANTITRLVAQKNTEDYKTVFNAIEQDRPSIVINFVNYNLQLINMQNHDGYTLLCYATHFGRKEIVDFLLLNGADPNIPTYVQLNTPLHIACHYKYKKIIEVLVNAGADESLLNKDQLAPWEGIVPKSNEF